MLSCLCSLLFLAVVVVFGCGGGCGLSCMLGPARTAIQSCVDQVVLGSSFSPTNAVQSRQPNYIAVAKVAMHKEGTSCVA